MIQSACDPGAPQKVARHAIRGRVCVACGTASAALPAKGVIPAIAVNAPMPATPSISRRVKRGCDAETSLCLFAITCQSRLPSVRQRKLARRDPRIKGEMDSTAAGTLIDLGKTGTIE